MVKCRQPRADVDRQREDLSERRSVKRGRGGTGNIHRRSIDTASPSRPAAALLSPVCERGATVDPERARTIGRGGKTATLVSDHAASIAEYEQSVVQQSEQNARACEARWCDLGNELLAPGARTCARNPCTTIPLTIVPPSAGHELVQDTMLGLGSVSKRLNARRTAERKDETTRQGARTDTSLAVPAQQVPLKPDNSDKTREK
ncbi:hypothetical protein C8T65DRAFT_698959 [Cerioporus squamosus]|nr:hypothetical protein C8T65DRAFT_698959 [Cerioporus squamosus]